MAVEARHPQVFRPQDRELLNLMNHGNVAAAQQMHFFGLPSSVPELPDNQAFQQPFYQQAAVCDSAPAKTSVVTDSALTYSIPPQRKRSRDCFNQQLYVEPDFRPQQKNSTMAQLPETAAFAGDVMFPQIQQYQYEINTIINQHTKKIRMELEVRQKQQARLLAAAIGEGVMKKLKEKDEQIQRLGKLNFVIQERMKSLHVENQLLRDIAQTSEATANTLRSNLERILLHIGGEEEDVESCCGSNDHGRDIEDAQEKEEGSRKCKICGEREACVLLLPCRHLCLCSGCGSGSQHPQACPVCNSRMTGTLHVNMSS